MQTASDIKVSIVTVVYNAECTIERAIQSVLAQTHPNIEYIIIDGKSTDSTMVIIDSYRDLITTVVSEEDGGIYDALNKGIACCTGEWIGILNSDDWYERDAISNILEAAVKYPEAAVIHGLVIYRKAGGQISSIQGHHSDHLPLRMIEHPGCFVQRKTYSEKGLFDTRWKLVADYELMLRFRASGVRFLLITPIISNFSEGGRSSSLSSALEAIKLKRQYKLAGKFKRAISYLYWHAYYTFGR